MTTLEISLLGKPIIQQDGRSLASLVSRKAQALLCYLAFTGQPHSRQALAGLLWGEMSEEKARRNLRVALSRMRSELDAYLSIQRRTLSFNRERPYQLDTVTFEANLQQKTPTIETLKAATDLYRGPFLDDFNLRDAPAFEEWVRLQQEHYRQMALDGLYRLSVMQTEAHQFSDSIATLNRLLKLEPWMEEAHRQLMLLLAVGGQRSAALAQYETCATLLAEELGVEPTAETIALYEKIRAEQLDDLLPHLEVRPAPAPRPLPPPFQVPPLASHFVGRSHQLETIVAALKAEADTAVQAIVGMGGVGKSALAAQVAAQLQGHFPDGILWANVATSEPMSVLESWAQLYGYDFSRVGDVESMAAAFRSAIADKRVLVVLDDVTSAARIRPLLPAGPHCRALLTLRDQDLARAVNAQVWRLHELSVENGRLLFGRILGNERIQAEPDAADAICNELAHLPLAVEITAQRLKSRPRRKLADLAQRLRDEKRRLSLLTISDREVRASFALSWETLDRDLKRVFSLLGLFAGRSFAAESVARIAKMDAYLLEDKLYALVALSLLREEGQTRYQLHPLLADFAREQLGDEAGEVYGRFTSYYLQFAQQNQTNYDALRPEWDNLMAAMEAAHTYQLHQTVIDFADALNDAWFKRGRYSQARQGFQWVDEATLKLNDKKRQNKNLLNWAQGCIEQSDFDEARRLLEKCLISFKETNDLVNLARAQFLLSRVAMNQSNYKEANQLVNNALMIRGQLNDQIGKADLIKVQARILYGQRLYQDAYTLGHVALKVYEENSHQLGILQTLNFLVNCQVELKRGEKTNLAKTLHFCQRALNLAEELQDTGEKVVALYGLSRIHLIIGDMELAEEQAKLSLEAAKQIGDRRTEAMVTIHLSEIYYYQREYNKALNVAYSITPLLQALEATGNEAVNWWNIGHFHHKLMELDLAHEAWSNSYHLANEIQNTGLLERLRPYLQS